MTERQLFLSPEMDEVLSEMCEAQGFNKTEILAKAALHMDRLQEQINADQLKMEQGENDE